ncbi:MAG: HAMP domain-containing histidine kinase [Actinobacteria bacterium]|nr:HAMP domain-containing histidine kinase [Actinomycetota bacterium]
MSLRRRVIIGFIAVAAVLVISNVAISSTFKSFLVNRVDHQLVTAGSIGDRRGGGKGPGRGQNAERNEAFTEYFQAVGDLSTGTLTAVGGYDPQQRPAPKLTTRDVSAHLTDVGEDIKPFTSGSIAGRGEWRVVVVASRFKAQISVLGISLDGVQDTLTHTRQILVAATIAALAALAFVSWWMIRLGVYPIAAMADTAEKITGGDMSLRVEHPDERTEAGRLGASLNAMLDRIQDAFRAREASEAKVRRFAADASHELRTPLTSIRGYAELYRAGGLNADAHMADAMRRIESEAKRMGVLVEDLLQLARLDQEQAVERRDVDLAEVANDAVADARAVEPQRPIDVSVVPAVVHADEPALRQVVANLLANVRSHTAGDTPARVTVRVDDGTVELAVSDEGPGMPDDVASHVFERFYRADESRTHGGTGLGLAIVDAIARAHGGTATVTSAEGEGARFAISLPLAASS